MEENQQAQKFQIMIEKVLKSSSNIQSYLEAFVRLVKFHDVSNNETEKILDDHRWTEKFEQIDQNLDDAKSHIDYWNLTVSVT